MLATLWRKILLSRAVVAVVASLSSLTVQGGESNHAGALAQDVYVWQRAWTPPVLAAISQHGTNFSTLVVLQAEVAWKDRKATVVRVPVDFQALAGSSRRIGVALRIGPFGGPFAADDERTKVLVELAQSLIAEARSNRVSAAELQIDFDCAESKLDGYRVWVRAIREAVRPIPVTITTLPSWLRSPAFDRLVAETDGYVLQVHSLERPKALNAPFTLCDPESGRRAVELAGRFGVPFRVALPTYGYVLAFDGAGKFIGLSAEGPSKRWPAGSQIREVCADPDTIATLMHEWFRNRPPLLTGIIWYRFPVEGDDLNWSWPTLAAVMAGRTPKSNVRAALRRPQSGLIEIDLLNQGDADYQSQVRIDVHWSGARLVASDGWRGFESTDAGANRLRFEARRCRLLAGERRAIGWLRLDNETEVELETQTLQGVHSK